MTTDAKSSSAVLFTKTVTTKMMRMQNIKVSMVTVGNDPTERVVTQTSKKIQKGEAIIMNSHNLMVAMYLL